MTRSAASLVSYRQHHPKSCAGSGFALDLDLPPMRFDNHLGLKHPNAQPLLLCGLKGAEKRCLQKCRAHSAAVVGDGKNCPTVALTGLNSHLASRSECLTGVEKQVSDYAGKLLPIQFKFWLQVKLLHHVDFRRAV